MKLQHSFRKGVQTPLSKKEIFEVKSKIESDYSSVKPAGSVELTANTRLSMQELLEISDKISLYYAPRILSSSKKLVLLTVDPQNLYAYWNLGDNKDYALSKDIADGKIVLRIYSKTDSKTEAVKLQQAEITINELQSGQKIRLSSFEKSADYSASIGKTISNKPFIPLLNTYLSDPNHNSSKQKIAKINKLDSVDSNNSVYNETQNNFRTEDEVSQSFDSVKSHYASTNCSGKGKKK